MQPPQSYKDEIAQKRTLAEQKQREQKTQTLLEGLATSSGIDDVIKQLKEVQLASLIGNNKPSVVLTDQTDLGDKISEAIKSIDASGMGAKQLSALKSLADAFDSYSKSQSKDVLGIKQSLGAVEAAVKALDMTPVVNVPEPKVTVKEKPIDFTPLQDTIRQVFTQPPSEKLDLSCYKAQDINNDVPDMQYVGFVNPDGNWYIIENDVSNNKLRYVFGESGYAEAFAKASTFQYGLLNEAIDAVTA